MGETATATGRVSSRLHQSQQPPQQQLHEGSSASRGCHNRQHHEEPFIVSLPFALKSAYAIAPTDPHGRLQLDKRAAAGGPHHSLGALAASSSLAADSSNGGTTSHKSDAVGEFLEEPAYTAFHGWQKGCIDYIFFGPSNLKVVQVYQLPSLLKQGGVGCCPNELWPASDHLSLVADLIPVQPSRLKDPANSEPMPTTCGNPESKRDKDR